MKLILLFAALVICAPANIKAQSDSTQKIKPWLVKVETMVGKNEKGILYKVSADTLELLPYRYKYRPFTGLKMLIDESRQMKLASGQIQSFTIQRKGAMNLAFGLGVLGGAITGAIAGSATTPKSDCSPNCILPENFGKFVNAVTGSLIGMGLGALTGFLVTKSKQKKFIIRGNQNKLSELQAELMDIVMVKE